MGSEDPSLSAQRTCCFHTPVRSCCSYPKVLLKVLHKDEVFAVGVKLRANQALVNSSSYRFRHPSFLASSDVAAEVPPYQYEGHHATLLALP